MSIIWMATYVCVGCGYSENIPSEGALRPCPRCEYLLHKCNCFPCCVMMVLEVCEKSGKTTEQVIAHLTSEWAEYRQPPLSDKELAAIRRYPTLADWEAYAYAGILAPDKEEAWTPAQLELLAPPEEVL